MKRKSLFSKMMENDNFRKIYENERSSFDIEYQLARIMEKNGVTQQDLADKLDIDKSVVSKDFSGAFKKAGIKKLEAVAEALDCEFIPLFVSKSEKKKIEEQFRKLLFGT